MISQATVGFTVGAKGGFKRPGLLGLKYQAGITLEGGVRQTVNLEKMRKENDPAGVAKFGASAEVTFLGTSVGMRIGFDSDDKNGRWIDFKSTPSTEGMIEVSGMAPLVGIGVSGTFGVNPSGAYLGSLPGVAPVQ